MSFESWQNLSKFDLSEGILDPGIPEQPFVKLPTGNSLLFKPSLSLFCFALPFFCAAPQQTEHLEEATHKAYQQYLQAQSRFGNGLIPVGGLVQNAPIQNNV